MAPPSRNSHILILSGLATVAVTTFAILLWNWLSAEIQANIGDDEKYDDPPKRESTMKLRYAHSKFSQSVNGEEDESGRVPGTPQCLSFQVDDDDHNDDEELRTPVTSNRTSNMPENTNFETNPPSSLLGGFPTDDNEEEENDIVGDWELTNSTTSENDTNKKSDPEPMVKLVPEAPFNLQKALKESRDKLETTATYLLPYCRLPRSLQLEPCTNAKEALAYRCRFTLQLIQVNRQWYYATRENGNAVPLVSGVYDIANQGLQELMKTLLQELNYNKENLKHVTHCLTSITFASSWDHSRTRMISLHYDNALQDEASWMTQAEYLRKACGATLISGRAKKVVLRTPKSLQESEIGTDDELWIQGNLGWKVSALMHPKQAVIDPDGTAVYFFKPEGAFCHPNPDVMYRALSWILSRVACTKLQHGFDYQIRLLELYCGCGAHSIPIAKSGLVSQLVAIELDERSVQACQRNILANEVAHIVQVVSEDVGLWSSHNQRRMLQGQHNSFDILLVDPPRQGLDDKVIDFALKSADIRNIIYISCGREALVRDLKVLTQAFEVVNCTLMDLFPGTDSVESLVHLRRFD